MKLKTILSVTMVVAMIALTGCMNDNSSSTTSDVIPPVMDESSTPMTDTTASDFRVGLGIVADTAESVNAGVDVAGNAQFNTTICALAINDKDEIVSVKFDSIKSSLGFDAVGAFTGDVASEVKTKKDLGYDYGLKEASGIGKEWFEQVASLEQWMVGRPISDALGMKVSETSVPDIDELRTSVTIKVSDQLKALEKAYADAKK